MTPHDARRVFLICHGLRWLPTGLVVPIMVLVLLERGVDLTEVGFVFAVYGAVTSLLELPTGGLADALGRKPVLLAGTVLDGAFAVGLLLGHSLWHFLFAAAMGAVGRALLSGPLEAWYVDTARTADPTIPLRPGLSAAGVVEALALAGGALLSAVLPLIGTAVALEDSGSLLALPIIAALAAQAVSFSAIVALVRETRAMRRGAGARILRSVPTIVADGLQLAVRSRDLRLIFSSTFFAVVAMVTVEVLWQPRFADLLGGFELGAKVNGFVVAGLSAAAAAGSWLANRLPAGIARDPSRAAAVVTLASAAALGALAAATLFAEAVVAFLVLYATTAAWSVLRSELLHDRVSAARRATMVSSLSIAQQAGNLVSSLTLVRLADASGIRVVWALGAGFILLQAALIALVRPTPAVRPDSG